MKNLSQERIGELMIVGETLLYSILPVIIAHTTKIMPPILFAGASTIVAAISTFIYIVLTKQLKDLKDPKTIKYSLLVSIFIIIIPSIFIFIGSSKTSGINTTILLQSEILATLLIFGILSIEKITLKKILGGILIFLGASFIVFNGTLSINTGDLLIFAGVFFYPIGNIYGKKALEVTSPSVILFIRNIFGGLVLTAISLLFETDTNAFSSIKTNLPIVLFSGIIIYHLSKLMWYEGIKRIDVTKATSITLGASPVLGLIFSMIFLKEIPTIFQMIGFVLILIGIFSITFKNKDALLNP